MELEYGWLLDDASLPRADIYKGGSGVGYTLGVGIYFGAAFDYFLEQ